MLVQTVFLIFYFVIIESTQAPTKLLVTRVGPCYEPQLTIGNVSELRVTTQMYDSKLSGEIVISENISNGWKIKTTIQKCVDIRNIDSCNFFKSFFLVNNGCDDDDEQSLYSTFFNFTTPKMKCPIIAGRYELQNYPFSSEANYVTMFQSKISTSVFGLTFRLDGYTLDRKKIFCVEMYLQLLYKRNHDWAKSTNNTATASPQTTQQTSIEDEDY